MPEKMNRREFHTLALSSAAMGLLPAWAQREKTEQFVHPGMLHNAVDLARMRDGVRNQSQPLFSGFEVMSANAGSQLSYRSSGGFAEIGRNPTIHAGEFDRDANAAYQYSLMWVVTGDAAYGKLAMGIVNDWSSKLKKVTGADAVLCASLGGFKMVNAAELLRHTASGWSEAEARRCEAMLRDVFLPVIYNFAPFANGNWDTAAIKLMMAIGIFCEDRSLFDRAVTYYLHGCGDGRLDHYIDSNGQCQESGRDQQHTQLGLAHMGDSCEMAWHQGLDLYGELNNRLLRGFEYTAKYELGEDVPFTPDVDRTGKYRHASIAPRSPLRNNFEQIYNHYVQRKGLEAPWTTKAAEKVRPEGAPFGADATGYGTLLYSRPALRDDATVQGAKTVVHADGSGRELKVNFVPLHGVSKYDVWRAEKLEGPFRIVARNVVGEAWYDSAAKPSTLCFYRVSAAESETASASVGQMLGLPPGWGTRSVGVEEVLRGTGASFDGSSYRLLSGSPAKAVPFGPYRAVERTLPAAGKLVARLLPLIASQSGESGILLRGVSKEVRLIVSPKGRVMERPEWTAILIEQSRVDEPKVIAEQTIGEPAILGGRITQPVWLQFAWTQGTIEAAISADGTAWRKIGSMDIPEGGLQGGMFVASGIAGVESDVVFDRVEMDDQTIV